MCQENVNNWAAIFIIIQVRYLSKALQNYCIISSYFYSYFYFTHLRSQSWFNSSSPVKHMFHLFILLPNADSTYVN